jgi:hypothetical protein
MVTVPQAIKKMGFEPEPDLCWSVGAIIANMYVKAGNKMNRPLHEKTNGGGTHCIADYPEEWRSKIEEVVRLHKTKKKDQGELF